MIEAIHDCLRSNDISYHSISFQGFCRTPLHQKSGCIRRSMSLQIPSWVLGLSRKVKPINVFSDYHRIRLNSRALIQSPFSVFSLILHVKILQRRRLMPSTKLHRYIHILTFLNHLSYPIDIEDRRKVPRKKPSSGAASFGLLRITVGRGIRASWKPAAWKSPFK